MIKNIAVAVLVILCVGFTSFLASDKSEINLGDPRFVTHTVDLQRQTLKFYWRNKNGSIYKNFTALKDDLNKRNEELVFAMNGGMYNMDHSPQGLYIENGELLSKLDETVEGFGNFYLQPNGVFYINEENEPMICETAAYPGNQKVKYATQSGPLLLINGTVHPRLIDGSKNLHIRNGVGILPDGNLLFAMSKKTINFYDFASFFKIQGCKNALYLDGFVSRTYLPSKNWTQMDGNFGVIIAETR